MKKTEILVVCCHPEISATIIRLIDKGEEMTGTAVSSPEEAIISFTSRAYDLVLIGAGLAPETEKQLEAELKKQSPEVPVVYHFGGGSGLLYTEIKRALNKR
ncbi:response regulator receiver protein [Pedobacter sp. KBW06]|uniref:response regulator n=1 Tax=Pedobacter sp. KBW06 TaxID=2153359 RepID=UPI000F59AA13|nr:response regulator [Pedobacter sp. KBW06]RQO70052.1 response regulator receiver protein [Pedobacter sp. KBW06]